MSRRPKKPVVPPPEPGPARWRSWLPFFVAAGAAALVATCTWVERRPPLTNPADGQDDPRASLVTVDYTVSAQDWPGRQPTLCEIVDRFELGEPARRATLYLNGRSGGCAVPTATARTGGSATIAVWAPAEFEQCAAEARSCR